MDALLRDLRFSLRLLRRTPGFTAVAVAVLSLGIGANTAIFSLFRDIAFSPRPFPDAAQVYQFYTQDTKRPGKFRQFSYPTYAEIRDLPAVRSAFTGVLAHHPAMVSVGQGAASRRVSADLVSSDYFRTLEVPLARGRDFTRDEERPGSAAQVVIASYVYWKNTGFDPRLVGRIIRINGRPFTVVGIAPKNFTGTMMLFGPEFYLPLGDYGALTGGASADAQSGLERRNNYTLIVVGRLRPGVTAAAAGAVLRTVATDLQREWPVEQKDQTLIIRPLPRLRTSTNPADESGLTVLGLMLCALAGIVLLVACLNLANLLLARGLARRKEIAVRRALGSGEGRIIRQLLTEGLVLSLLGGGGGCLIGGWSSGLFVASLGRLMPAAISLRGVADPVVLAVTLGFSTLATLLFALGPALKLIRGSVVSDLKEQAGGTAAAHRHRRLPRNPLVVVQIALSLGLLTAAGLLVRGALKAGDTTTGFKADSTILAEADASLAGFDETRSLQMYRAACDRLSTLPGVQAVSIASTVPFGLLTINRPVQRAGANPAVGSHPATAADGLAFAVRWTSVGADYFTAMGLPLVRGRPFTRTEAGSPGAPAVAIIDEVLAKKLWPDGDPIGRHIQWAKTGAPTAFLGGSGTMGISDDLARSPRDARSVEIVGVVPATRWELFQSSAGGHIYVPFAQGFRGDVFFCVRTARRVAGTDASLFDLIRRELRATAPGVPVFAVQTFRQHLEANLQLWVVRAAAVMVTAFGGLALALAVVGLYGVKACSVARRTREFGIRMALGAAPGEVVRMVLAEGLVMTASGVGLGLVLALVIGRAISGMIYHVSPADPLAFTIAAAVMTATALAACWLPARRAARVDPIVALRAE